MIKPPVFLLLLFAALGGFAQNRYVNWFFGYGSGLPFDSGGSSVVSGGKTASEEGVACISDPCGNLLFYSDGTTIWNRKHNVMYNGSGLDGNTQSAEAVLIIPLPLSDSLFYVFTTDAYGGAKGVHYTIVDMSKQGGDGEVISKNVQLYSLSSEKLTAIQHANKKDYWILTHDWDNSEYKVFLLSETGLNSTPVVSVLGPTTNSSIENALGHLRPSPDGTLVASSFWYLNTLDIYTFNNSSGGLTLKTSLTNFDHSRPYGVEFSPDNKTLYVGEAATTGNNDIYQFDVTASNAAGSRYTVATASYRFGNFVCGPDGKFYVSKFNQNSLGVITNPNTFGSGVNYVANGFSLGAQKSMLGLPNTIFPILLSNPQYDMSAVPGCKLSDPVKLQLISNYCYDSLLWDLSDFSSGNNYSRKRKLTHIYPYSGNYDITLMVYYRGKSYKITQNVRVPATPVVNLGKDTFFCGNFSYFLDAGNIGASYLWQDNYQGRIRNATQPGKYYVKVSFGNCSSSDTINIKGASGTMLGRDTLLCFAPSFNYTQPLADSIHWTDGVKGISRTFNSPGGIYGADVFRNGCKTRDSIRILLPAMNGNPLPPDTTICEGNSININLPATGIQYLWNDGTSGGTRTLNKPGYYRLVESLFTCNRRDSFNLGVIPRIKLRTFTDTSLCLGDTMRVKISTAAYNLRVNGFTAGGTSLKFFLPGPYQLLAYNSCFRDSSSFNLTVDSCRSSEVLFPDIFSPNGDMLNDEFKPVILGDAGKITEYSLKIFNRWGEEIFFTDDYSKGWNGQYLGQPCALGEYLWLCRFKYMLASQPESRQQKGSVLIIR